MGSIAGTITPTTIVTRTTPSRKHHRRIQRFLRPLYVVVLLRFLRPLYVVVLLRFLRPLYVVVLLRRHNDSSVLSTSSSSYVVVLSPTSSAQGRRWRTVAPNNVRQTPTYFVPVETISVVHRRGLCPRLVFRPTSKLFRVSYIGVLPARARALEQFTIGVLGRRRSAGYSSGRRTGWEGIVGGRAQRDILLRAT